MYSTVPPSRLAPTTGGPVQATISPGYATPPPQKAPPSTMPKPNPTFNIPPMTGRPHNPVNPQPLPFQPRPGYSPSAPPRFTDRRPTPPPTFIGRPISSERPPTLIGRPITAQRPQPMFNPAVRDRLIARYAQQRRPSGQGRPSYRWNPNAFGANYSSFLGR